MSARVRDLERELAETKALLPQSNTPAEHGIDADWWSVAMRLRRELAAANKRADNIARQLSDAEAMVTQALIDQKIATLQKQCEEHIRRADEAERDAARYRWLRDKSVPPHNFYISVPVEFHEVRYSPWEVDAYIDEAMKND